MTLEYVYTIFELKKSNVNIVVIRINQVKFEHHLVMMIGISSGIISWLCLFEFFIKYFIHSGSEDTWFYIWKREPRSNENISKNTKLTRKQRLYFDRAYERIHGAKKLKKELKNKKKKESYFVLVHNAMVTSAIFAPNPVLIMNYLYSVSDSLPSAICSSTSIAATSSIDNNPTSSIDSSATANGLISMNSSTYVMVTADSKGQLKLLVNRYHR